MNLTKTSTVISDNHDSFVIQVVESGSHFIYKNGNYIESLEIEDCPIEIQEKIKLELRRLNSNLDADLQMKYMNSKK